MVRLSAWSHACSRAGQMPCKASRREKFLTLSYQDILFLTAASATVLIILLKRLVMFAGRLRACLHCGCQLNTGAKSCLLCGHTLKPRVSEHIVASVRSSPAVGSRASYSEPTTHARQRPVTMVKVSSAAS